MGNYNRNNRGSGRGGYGQRDFRRQSFGGRSGDRQMYRTVCSNCGKDCEVPFRPTGTKPVYCSDCFEKMGGGSDSNRFQDRGPRRNDFHGKSDVRPQGNEQMEAINRKLDKILEMLSRTPVKEEKVAEVKPEEKPVKPEETPVKIDEPEVAKKTTKTPKKKAPAKSE